MYLNLFFCCISSSGTTQTRKRLCGKPPPYGTGKDCEGPAEETRACVYLVKTFLVQLLIDIHVHKYAFTIRNAEIYKLLAQKAARARLNNIG